MKKIESLSLKNEFKKFKMKNSQSIIWVIALMLVTAGYYNYLGKQRKENNTLQTVAMQNETEAEQEKIGEAKFVDSKIDDNDSNIDIGSNVDENTNVVDTNSNENLNDNNNNTSSNEIKSHLDTNVNNNNSIDTAAKVEYFTNCKLEREKMYSQMLDVYQKILESSTISEEQKTIASNEIVKINNIKNAIMIAEDLIKNKEIDDCVIFVNGDSVNVIVRINDLTDAKTAQICEIVTRELKVQIENVHISKK